MLLLMQICPRVHCSHEHLAFSLVHWPLFPHHGKAFLAHGRSFSRSHLAWHVPAAMEPSLTCSRPRGTVRCANLSLPSVWTQCRVCLSFRRPVILSVFQMIDGVYPRRVAGFVFLPFFLAMLMYTTAHSSLEHWRYNKSLEESWDEPKCQNNNSVWAWLHPALRQLHLARGD